MSRTAGSLGSAAGSAFGSAAVAASTLVASEDAIQQGQTTATAALGRAIGFGSATAGGFGSATSRGLGGATLVAATVAATAEQRLTATAGRTLGRATSSLGNAAGGRFGSAAAGIGFGRTALVRTTLVAAAQQATTTRAFRRAIRLACVAASTATQQRLVATARSLGSAASFGFTSASNSEHSVEQLEPEALGAHQRSEHHRTEYNVPLHRAMSPLRWNVRSRTDATSFLHRLRDWKSSTCQAEVDGIQAVT
jgi:hypothetical protein